MERGMKIIIIDDEINIIESIKAFIGDKYSIEGFTSSQQGIEKLRKEKYDLLILDYQIDSLDGIQVVNQIRKFDNELYILLLTGYSNKIPGLDALEDYNIQNYYEKTADIEKIIIFIEGIIKSIEFFRNKKNTIAERIKELRKLNNLSQDDVAKYLDVQRTSVSLYESGDAIPPTLSILKLAKLFNVTTDYILCYEFKVEKR